MMSFELKHLVQYRYNIITASQKLEIDGSTLVIEKDGTPITDDDILLYLKDELMLLLTKSEIWCPASSIDSKEQTTSLTPSSSNSTVTVADTESESSNEPVINIPIINVDSNFEIL